MDSPIAERAVRRAFVLAAHDKALETGVKPTQSYIASITGVSRLEVRAILRRNAARAVHETTRIEHLVAGWQTDSIFLDAKGQPKKLSLAPGKGSFSHLAKKYGRDVTARVLRDQLLRLHLAGIDGHKIILSKVDTRTTRDVVAAQSDIRFLAAQLASFNFPSGKRNYVVRRGVITARDSKDANVAKRIAVERFATVLNSLNEISADRSSMRDSKGTRSHRLLVSAVVATESEEKET